MSVTPRRPRLFAAVLLLGAMALVAGCGGPEARRASHMARGEKYLAAGNLEKARIEFGNALQIAPNDAEARFMSGRVAERLGNLRGAVGMYQGTIEVNPEHVQARANLARIYVVAGAPQKALGVLEPGLAKHPDDPDLLTVRGAARAQLGDSAGALTDGERALKLAPTNENTVALLASLYRQAKQNPRAIELVSATLTKAPDSVDMRQVLAQLYVAAGDTKRAEEQLIRLTQIKPRELVLWLQLASFYTLSKRLDDAEHTFKAAMMALPESDTIKLVYADFLSTYRSRADGERVLRALIAQDPRSNELRLGLGTLLEHSGATQEAVTTYQEVVARDPDGPKGINARDRIAAIDAAAGHYEPALTLLGETLKKNPRDSDALALRANIALVRGDPLSAIADLRAVLRDQPNSIPVLRSLARAHAMNREPALAEESLRKALQLAPKDGALRAELAQFLLQNQRTDEAIALVEEGVRAAPTDTALRTQLVSVYLAKPDLAAARAAAEDLKRLQPKLAAGPYLAGVVAQQQQRTEEARREFEHALQLQPGALDVLTALARLDVAAGHRERALSRVSAAAQQDPKNGYVRNLEGELLFEAGRKSEALTAFRRANDLAPKWWLSYRNLALAQGALGDTAGSLATLQSGVQATGEPALVTGLATLYEQQGRIDDAIRQYEALRERDPRSQLAANNLAMLLVTYRHDQASLDRARDLTAGFAKSDAGELLDTYGWVMFNRGEVTQALSALERASAQSADSRVIRYHLAMAELKTGASDKARADLESALAGNASFAGSDEARRALAELTGRAG